MTELTPVEATKISLLSLTLIFGFSLFATLLVEDGILTILLTLATLSLLLCITLVFMALRKFGAKEMDVGSRILKKANYFGFIGVGFIVLVLTRRLYTFNTPSGILFLVVALIFVFGIFVLGKKKFKYW
ncbi:MAG: hypothetical protein V1921_02075 [Candidatus Altiarchaeota archaeon]